MTVSLSKEEYSAVLEQTDLLKEAGFEISDFGPGLIAVREVPVMLENEDVTVLLSEIAGKLLDKSDPTPAKLDWMYKNMACRAAVKAGDDTPPAEQEKFIEYVLSHREVRYCPHGRPILIRAERPADRSQEEKIIDKDFYREYNFRGNTAMALYRSGTALFL